MTDAVEIVAMLLIPVAFLRTFGVMVGDKKQGWALFAAAATLFAIGTVAIVAATAVPHGIFRSGRDRQRRRCGEFVI